jgi:hypothetical protein
MHLFKIFNREAITTKPMPQSITWRCTPKTFQNFLTFSVRQIDINFGLLLHVCIDSSVMCLILFEGRENVIFDEGQSKCLSDFRLSDC